jgi:Ca2+-binding EF-hand superfamily protein
MHNTPKKLAVSTLFLLASSGVFAAATDLSADEVKAEKAYIDGAFSKIDANGDGKIDKAEWDGFMTGFLKTKRDQFNALFTEADTNHDGKLSRDEAKKANPLLAEHFTKIDTNKDGFLTAPEIRAALNNATMK